MDFIEARELSFSQLNETIRRAGKECRICACQGQRFIAAGMSGKTLVIDGVPGNALGAYLGGGSITVNGNAQDAVGDTMNAGRIVVRGSIGDAAGYAMRGGELYVEGNAGYRAGIHMKAYGDKRPVMVIGGKAGSFLGEYQAGGVIIVLGLTDGPRPIVSNFPCTGMHGGRLYIRSDCKKILLPKQVIARPASRKDMNMVRDYLHTFCELFGGDCGELLRQPFTVITPNSSNPYKQFYVTN